MAAFFILLSFASAALRSVIVALVFGIGLFMLLPTVLVGFVKEHISSGVLATLTEGVIRIALFLAYISLVSQMKDIRRVFEYHGAEHKTIFCYESGEELTVENARKFSRLHPRCGTSFLLIVMVVSPEKPETAGVSVPLQASPCLWGRKRG